MANNYGPQYGGYPAPPPPPARKSRAGLIVVGIVGVLAVIGTAFVLIGGRDDDPADAVPGPATTRPVDESPSVPSGSPTAADSPSAKPSPSGPPACKGCFPGVTVTGLVNTLKSKGYTCKEDRVLGIECDKGNLEIGIDRAYSNKGFVESVDVGGRATGKGEFPQGPGQAFATLKAGLPGVLGLAVHDAGVRQQITAFTNQHAGQPNGGPSAVKEARYGVFRLSIHGYSGATVGRGARASSSFSTSVTIYAASAFE
ncbi:hypothetical protein [Kribbella sp. NPDC051770]|uniref:hypothetical protein n=1 Tax=Kribbella sp. NPDC051770 TaxID=3155413 RepID=UPI00343ED55D